MQNLAGTSDDRTLSFSHNPAGQITSRTDSNTGYAWTDFVNFDEATSYNGLNQLLSVTAQSTAPQYDGRGNMTRDHQGQTYEYDHYNRLSGVGTSIDLAYDPAGRLQETSGTGITFREMQYDGLDLIAEYDSTGTLTARYVHGPGADEPLVQYAGSAVSTRQWLLADERGSIVAVTDWSGAAIQINSYDEYGAPAPGNAGRFGYTGQVWLPETGLYHYKNRAYHPELGRFMQTDPIGVNGGMNLYAYVGGDPVNFVDPLGLEWVQRDRRISVCSVSDGVETCTRSTMWYWVWVPDPTDGTPSGGGRWLINPNQILDRMMLGGDQEQSCDHDSVSAGNALRYAATRMGDLAGVASNAAAALGAVAITIPEPSPLGEAAGVGAFVAGNLAVGGTVLAYQGDAIAEYAYGYAVGGPLEGSRRWVAHSVSSAPQRALERLAGPIGRSLINNLSHALFGRTVMNEGILTPLPDRETCASVRR